MCSPIERRIRESCPAGAPSGGAPARRRAPARVGPVGRLDVQRRLGGAWAPSAAASSARSARPPSRTTASTSCLRTRPPRPVPSHAGRGRRRARRRSAARRASSGGRRALARAARAGSGCGRGRRGASPAAVPRSWPAAAAPSAARPRSRAPRRAWRRWRSAPARCRPRPSRRPRRGSRPAPGRRRRAPRCRSCRSRSRRSSPRRPTQSPACLRHSTMRPLGDRDAHLGHRRRRRGSQYSRSSRRPP